MRGEKGGREVCEPLPLITRRPSPDATEETEDEEDGVGGRESGCHSKHTVDSQRCNETGASTNQIRETSPHIPTHHHAQEDDGI